MYFGSSERGAGSGWRLGDAIVIRLAWDKLQRNAIGFWSCDARDRNMKSEAIRGEEKEARRPFLVCCARVSKLKRGTMEAHNMTMRVGTLPIGSNSARVG